MDVFTTRTGRGTKVLQFDVCCEAVDQNFDCGYIKVVMQIHTYQRVQTNKKELQYRKFGITGLKTSRTATKKYAYTLGYHHYTSRYDFPKLSTTVPFYIKSG